MTEIDLVGSLQRAIAQAGTEWTAQPSRLRRRLDEVLGSEARNHRSQVHLIIVAAEEKVPVRLRRTGWSDAERDDVAHALAGARGWTNEAAEWAVVMWAAALGLTDERPADLVRATRPVAAEPAVVDLPGSDAPPDTVLPTDGTALPNSDTVLPTDGTVLPTDGTVLPAAGTVLPAAGLGSPAEGTVLPNEAGALPEPTVLPTPVASTGYAAPTVLPTPESPPTPVAIPDLPPPSPAAIPEALPAPRVPLADVVPTSELPTKNTKSFTKRAAKSLGHDVDVAYEVRGGPNPAIILGFALPIGLIGVMLPNGLVRIVCILVFTALMISLRLTTKVLALRGDDVWLLGTGLFSAKLSKPTKSSRRADIEFAAGAPFSSIRLDGQRLWFFANSAKVAHLLPTHGTVEEST